MSAVPLRVLEFSSHESNSVQSLQFSNRLFSRRLCIFHFPTKKSKSFGDDVDDAAIFRSPLVSKLNFGIGRLGSMVRTVCCARAWSRPVPLAPMLQIATPRIVIKYFISQFSDVIVRSSTVEQFHRRAASVFFLASSASSGSTSPSSLSSAAAPFGETLCR